MTDTAAAEHHQCDVLVIGSGAGGLSAAVTAAKLGLKVLVVEKEDVYGGTTARSGGWLWIPCNGPSAREGIVQDSVEAARTYLQHETGNHFDAARVDAFLAAGPKMVEFFETETEMRFVTGPTFSDYHPDAPGGVPAGRSICAEPYDGRRLGPELKRLRPPLKEITFVGMMIGSGKELLHFFNVTRSVKSAAFVAGKLAAHMRDLALHGRAVRLTNGNALAGRLAKSAFDAGVELWTSSPATALTVEDGRVVGATISRDGRPVTVSAAKGVVLAAGGFPQDLDRRRELFPHQAHYSPAPSGNTGDGLRLGEAAGATVETGYPHAAAWVPVSQVPWPDGTMGTFPHFIDRAKPGVIAVTARGVRFVNEGNSYHDFVQAMRKACEGLDENAAWLLCDHPTIRRYGLGFVKPFPLPLTPHINSGYLKRGRTLAELAAACGIDAAAFERTVEAFNGPAKRGEDPAFAKGSTAYNRSLGDPTVAPNPCVAPVARGPFYAVKLVVGDLGTFAGVKTDADARVLDRDGRPIPGLYAAGNDNASIMGGNYPGGGITLGPAMTFGWVAARRMAGMEG